MDEFRNDLEPLLNTQRTGSLLPHHTPTHTLLVGSGNVSLLFFFFFFMDTSHLPFPYHSSPGKLIRELKFQDRKGPGDGIYSGLLRLGGSHTCLCKGLSLPPVDLYRFSYLLIFPLPCLTPKPSLGFASWGLKMLSFIFFFSSFRVV